MKGDFTRSTWDRTKHYGSVRMQQGRVQVDADWNEQADIAEHLRETTTRDVIGPCGAPLDGGGFEISIVGGGADLELSAGRFYVDGILCEAEDPITYTAQGDFPNAPLPPDMGLPPSQLEGPYLVYLDVWRRHVTALEDPEIRERALGGPDTATRVQVVRQVKLFRARFGEFSVNCSRVDPQGWQALIAPSSGRLRARTQAGVTQTDPCIVPAQAGYTRLENQLYRVEVHDGGPLGTATFKWSRNNGSVVTEWLAQNGNELTVRSTGPDKLTGFHDAAWIELTDDTRELRGEPGILVQVVRVEGEVIEIDPGSETVDRTDFPANPKVRRWDLPDTATGAVTVEAPAANQGYLALENGIEVRFEAGDYRTGDHWTIPARAFVGEFAGEIEWPQEGPNQGAALAPEGIEHHYCKLGFVDFQTDSFTDVLTDCRPRFPAATELLSFYRAGGDGQQALPGTFLPCPLQVAVTNGEHPVEGTRVRFAVIGSSGRLEGSDGNLATTVVIETDTYGIARCRWQMPSQVPTGARQCIQVNVTHLEDGVPSGLPVLNFSAEVPEARHVVYDPSNCPPLQQAGVDTVQEAIDEICQSLGQGGNEPGVRIEAVTANATGQALLNDAPLHTDVLAQGLVINCDRDVAPEAFSQTDPNFVEPAKPNCTVTLDLPYPVGPDSDFWGISEVVGFQPIVLRANVSVDLNIIVWEPHPATANWIQNLLFNRQLSPGDEPIRRILCHLKLKGNFVWGEGIANGDVPALYVDGDNYGGPDQGRIRSVFPSGDGRRGGDFEMWFWLEEPPQEPITGITVTATGGSQSFTANVRDQLSRPVQGAVVSVDGFSFPPQTTNQFGNATVNTGEGIFTARATFDKLSDTDRVTVGSPGIRGLQGVGSTYGDRLKAAGVSTVGEVAALDAQELAKILETSETRAEKILVNAKERAEKAETSNKPRRAARKGSRPKKKPARKGKKT